MDRKVLVTELQRALKLHMDLAVHPQRVPGNRFLKCFMKPFVKQGILFFAEVAKGFCLKTGFLARLCQWKVFFRQHKRSLVETDWSVIL